MEVPAPAKGVVPIKMLAGSLDVVYAHDDNLGSHAHYELFDSDETDIEGNISSECAFWPGDEGLSQAKKWFEEQFGVTFTEETRKIKTYIIRKSQDSKVK